MTRTLNVREAVCAVALSLLLALSGAGAGASVARADELDDAQAAADQAQQAVDGAQSVLDSAEAEMSEIVAACDKLTAEIERLQSEIDVSVAEVMEAQEAMLAGRAALGSAAQYEYRTGGVGSLLSLLVGATDFQDFLRNFEYLSQIMEYQNGEITAQKQRKQQFEEISDKLSAQKDEQERALAELEEKRAEAERVVADAAVRLGDAQADQASRLAALQEQAARFAEQAASGGASIADDANTVDRADVVPDGTPVAPNPDAGGGSSGGDNGGSAGGGTSSGGSASGGNEGGSGGGFAGGADADAGWMSGIASAYGGSSDPYTPNPGITATGAVCDDWSMGVAVPMSMPNYRSYFGRTVEIRYGGMTVYAVVNDCGYMGGGSRVLDLQPGVFKAFGFGDCYAWGLRTVSYRFL